MSSGYDDHQEYDSSDRDGSDDRSPRTGQNSLDAVKSRVRGPAVALLITGVISLVIGAINLANALNMDRVLNDVEAQWDNDPKLKPQQKQDLKNILNQNRDTVKIVFPVVVVLGIFTAFISIIGAVRMMNLSGRGLAMTGSVLSMLPIFSACCCLGLPFGAWALLTLMNPEVKAAFTRHAYGDRDDMLDQNY